MNRKAFELAISTLIIIILGILVLIGIIYAVTDGFKKFKDTTQPFTDITTASAVKSSCQNACQSESKIIYCCSEYEIDSKEIMCSDPRLEIDCAQNFCDGFQCGE